MYNESRVSFAFLSSVRTMPVETRSQAREETRSIQSSPLLVELPRELRDMIYDHLFARRTEYKIFHPIMRTSKQLREEATTTLARILGSGTILHIEDYGHTDGPFFNFYHKNADVASNIFSGHPWISRGRQRYQRSPYPEWQVFCCSDLGKEMLPRMAIVAISILLDHMMHFVQRFSGAVRSDTAAELEAIRENQSRFQDRLYRVCLTRYKRWEKRSVTCSAEWIDAFLADMKRKER
ncbi:hypothetical protein AUEXF2481DRAFT_26733 [Aureobasidium subglaciale EXF-2481]|uniref:F-box domain-containing protein n=1 Tax=Aureobasidium subglaciale (strain EXF-2481) TaxID=1043005 RepID=A0A074YKY3_AURSE|nr:uncharacterized protein AUEXF2481DRAFT_26733 [Aureobasidium subglaciale EXF-2481]KEQ98350.1 hypothetical protein AUEXF2481DRAFT_26733 [Aureobasidium subglaciale EXF-2481]